MHGIAIGTVGTQEIIQGTAHDAGKVALRTWEGGVPNSEHASVVQEIVLSREQAQAYLALLTLAVNAGARP